MSHLPDEKHLLISAIYQLLLRHPELTPEQIAHDYRRIDHVGAGGIIVAIDFVPSRLTEIAQSN